MTEQQLLDMITQHPNTISVVKLSENGDTHNRRVIDLSVFIKNDKNEASVKTVTYYVREMVAYFKEGHSDQFKPVV